jgi:protein arginine kinase activator
MEQLPERHLECSGCKKPITVCYTEIVGKTMYRLGMCDDCPILRQKLHGTLSPALTEDEAKTQGLTCGGCGTSADEVRMGASLGCSMCYDVFEEILINELVAANRMVQKVLGGKKLEPLHLGRIPGQASEINPAIKLLALHQALHETLGREDYEQAAWLRDQIKALTEEKKDGSADERH